MKHFRSILLILLAVLTAAGCSPKQSDTPGIIANAENTAGPDVNTSDEPAPREDDFDNRFGQGSINLAETEDAYYYSPPSGKYIYYYDKATGDYGVLCAKPECMHDEGSDENCNGRANLCMKSVCNWDGKLHFVSFDQSSRQYCLYSLSYDGSEREKEAVIELGDYIHTAIPRGYDYHRGMLYCYVDYEKVTGGVPSYATELFTVDPETGELTRFFADEEDPEVCVHEPGLFYYRQYVYFLISKWYREDDGTPHIEIELRRYDTETAQVEDVYSGVMDPGGSIFRYWVESEDRIYLMPQHCAKDNTPKLYLLSGGELSVLHEFDAVTAEYGVSTYLFEGAIAFFAFMDERLKVCAYDGTVICDGPLDLSPVRELVDDDAEISYYLDMYGDSREMFVNYAVRDPSGKLSDYRYYFVRYTFREDGAEATLLVGNARMY